MSTQNINGYPLERVVIGDDDYFDIDYYNGVSYETAKVKGSVIKALATAINIYNSDGQLEGNRTVDGNQFILGFTDLQAAVFQIVPPIVPPYFEAGMSVQVDTQFLATGQGRPFVVVRTQDGQILFASVEDGRVNVNNTYFLPAINGTDGQALLTNGLSQPTLIWTNVVTDQFVNFAQTQWAKELDLPVPLNNGTIANGFTFFNNVGDKSANGTTSYDEYNISYTRIVTLTGTNGTANINIGGTDYLVTFNTSLSQTALDFVNTHATNILNSTGERVINIGDTIKFGCETLAQLNAITILNVTGNLSGAFDVAVGDHLRIPYVGQPYAGQRLTHNFRVNFGITNGSTQTVALSLRRWEDDSIIGSEIPIFRNQDVTGQQENFVSYTASALDPFVTGGFYFALRNDSGTNIDIEGSIGILIITEYQKSTKF